MALKGTLRDFSLADIFQLIGIQRKTGVLTLKSDKDVATVSFVDGNVVAADSLHRRLEDRLGTVLVKSGRITETQLQEALKTQKSTLKRMGNILVDSGFIDSDGLRTALHIQISQMVYRLFRWRDGEYNFSQEQRVDYDAEHVVPMSAESILMEGARILDEWPMIEKAIKSFATIFGRANVEIVQSDASSPTVGVEGDDGARSITLNEEEKRVHALVDGRLTVQDIVERSTSSEFETCRVLYELVNRQLIEEIRAGAVKSAAPAPAVRERSGAPVLIGLGYLLLVLVAGGVTLLRVGTQMAGAGGETAVDSLLSPILGQDETAEIRSSVDESHLQRLDFALQVYYLLNRGYPAQLHYLVTSRIVRPQAIDSRRGMSFAYEIVPGGYRLSLHSVETGEAAAGGFQGKNP